MPAVQWAGSELLFFIFIFISSVMLLIMFFLFFSLSFSVCGTRCAFCFIYHLLPLRFSAVVCWWVFDSIMLKSISFSCQTLCRKSWMAKVLMYPIWDMKSIHAHLLILVCWALSRFWVQRRAEEMSEHWCVLARAWWQSDWSGRYKWLVLAYKWLFLSFARWLTRILLILVCMCKCSQIDDKQESSATPSKMATRFYLNQLLSCVYMRLWEQCSSLCIYSLCDA